MEIFFKTRRAWTFFLNTWNLPLLSFFYFFWFWVKGFGWNVGVFWWNSGTRVWFFLGIRDKKKGISWNSFGNWKKSTLLLGFWFLRMLESLLIEVVISLQLKSDENGRHLQKTMHYSTDCDVAVAQVRVLFFICLLGCFWLL